MKKLDYWRINILSIKRYKKKLKRNREGKNFEGENSVFSKEVEFHKTLDRQRRKTFKSNLYEFLKKESFIQTKHYLDEIYIIDVFSFSENYENTIWVIQQVAFSIINSVKQEIKINFSKCKIVDHSALIVLKIIVYELIEDIKDFNKNLLYLPINLKIKVIESKEKAVNTDLVIFNFLSIEETDWDKEGFQPIHTIYPLGFIKGLKSQKNYIENKKGTIVTRIVSYINECLMNHDVSLDAAEKNSIEGLVSEVLNNAEDHSPMSTYYINANFSQKNDATNSKSKIGQLNLSVMNFGYSIFDGFEETKEDNKKMYSEMEEIFNKVNSGYKHNFTKESLFTLYALQEGFSRLKYEDDSRGTGTMKFINSFFQIGDYEDVKNNLYPSLNLFSGFTHIYCNNEFKPFKKDDVYFISLNSTQDIFALPSREHLINLQKKFPGTVFSAKIFLNREHLIDKINKDGNDKN